MKSFRGTKFFALLFITFLFLTGIYFLLPKQSSVFPTKPGQERKEAAYSKRQFDINKNFFQAQPYPNELISIGNRDLVGMKCSPEYVRQAGGEYTLGTDPESELKDVSLLGIITNLNKTIVDNYIAAFTACDTEDMMRIVEYEIWGGGGGSKNVAYFGVVNASGTVEEVTSIKNDGTPYFTCDIPLQLTSLDLLYYECRGGDGGSGSASIYKIDLNKKLVTRVIKCDSSANLNGNPTLQCE